ncbi:MAG: ABC transporter substrate-binding protein [Rhodospirillales bacterium]|nr:ABC transporter substrate-binding protein [Rhodospirillales bacterium]MDE2200143.1 ABC transporter substrate-binding protein [Rhodospirillales bacterium]MDE2575960.1 ABC transporter substrate-binding protein [Rhodospirillales bacterium]
MRHSPAHRLADRIRHGVAHGVVLAALLAGIAPARAADLTIALSAAPSSADPYYHDVGPNNALAAMVFGALVRTGPRLHPHPDLATAWSVPDDHSWKFTLDPKAVFQDGAPFTANDVVFSLCRARTGVGPTKSFTNIPKALTSVDIPDAHSIILHTRAPEPVLLMQLAGFSIVSAHSAGAVSFSAQENCGVAAMPDSAAFDHGPMANGTGPYRLLRFTNNDAIRLAANPRYDGPRPHWSHVTLRPISAAGARLAGLLSGDFDLIENPQAQDLPVLRRHGGFAWTITPSNRIIFLQPDIGRSPSPLARGPNGANPLADPRVREAISLAIDRKAITSRLMEGLGVPADQFLPPGLFGALPHPPPRPYDPVLARKLLGEAGLATGISLTLSAPRGRYIDDAEIAQAIAQYLTRIGIHTIVDAMTPTMFFPHRTKRDFSLSLGGWGYGTGEASDLLRHFVVSPMPARGLGGSDYGAYHSAAFDSAFLQAITTMNDGAREKLLEQATSIALADNALIPLHWETSVWAYKDRYTFIGRMDQRTDPDNLSLKAP